MIIAVILIYILLSYAFYLVYRLVKVLEFSDYIWNQFYLKALDDITIYDRLSSKVPSNIKMLFWFKPLKLESIFTEEEIQELYDITE